MSRVTQDTTKLQSASDTGLSPSMVKLSRLFSSPNGCYSVVLQPRGCVATTAVWALPRSLATTGGIINLFSLPRGTKMFQFPRFASGTAGCPPFRRTGCPIRKSADHRSFAPTRGLSQLITSFIASVSQGIHLAPFLTFSDTVHLKGERHVAHTFSCCFLNLQFCLLQYVKELLKVKG